MKLTRSLSTTAWAFSALEQSQFKNNEAESSTLMRTTRIIQVLLALNQLNELVRSHSDTSKITPLRWVIIERCSPLR
jgi:hypothetical protein